MYTRQDIIEMYSTKTCKLNNKQLRKWFYEIQKDEPAFQHIRKQTFSENDLKLMKKHIGEPINIKKA